MIHACMTMSDERMRGDIVCDEGTCTIDYEDMCDEGACVMKE